eukprot:scaffold1033_cov135-Isochrysis_galbana.AAC.2
MAPIVIGVAPRCLHLRARRQECAAAGPCPTSFSASLALPAPAGKALGFRSAHLLIEPRHGLLQARALELVRPRHSREQDSRGAQGQRRRRSHDESDGTEDVLVLADPAELFAGQALAMRAEGQLPIAGEPGLVA